MRFGEPAQAPLGLLQVGCAGLRLWDWAGEGVIGLGGDDCLRPRRGGKKGWKDCDMVEENRNA